MPIKKFDKYIILYGLIIFLFSTIKFITLEPSIDQIRHISWAIDVKNSSRLIDLNIFNFKLDNLQQSNSFFVNVFKPAYSDIGHIFNILPIIFLSILYEFNSNYISIFNLTSILFYSFSLILFFKIILLINSKIIGCKIKLIDFFILILYSTLPYFFYFSALGLHNIAIFFLILTVYLILKNENLDIKFIFKITIVSILGIFCHKTNLFFLPIIIFFFIAEKKKFNYLLVYFSLNLIFLLPLILIVFLLPSSGSSSIYFANFDLNINIILKNFKLWFIKIGTTINYINLFIFCISFFFVIKYFKKTYFLIIIVFAHLLYYLLINSFSIYYLRINLYLTYFILIFIIIFYLEIINKYSKFTSYLRSIFIILILFNLFIIYKVNHLNYLDKNYYNFYFKNNNKINIFLKDNLNISNNSKLLVFDNSTLDYLKVYNKKIYSDYLLNSKPLKNLISNNKYENILYGQKKVYLLSISPSREVIKKKFNQYRQNSSSIKCELNEKNLKKKLNVINGNYNIYLDLIFCN